MMGRDVYLLTSEKDTTSRSLLSLELNSIYRNRAERTRRREDKIVLGWGAVEQRGEMRFNVIWYQRCMAAAYFTM